MPNYNPGGDTGSSNATGTGRGHPNRDEHYGNLSVNEPAFNPDMFRGGFDVKKGLAGLGAVGPLGLGMGYTAFDDQGQMTQEDWGMVNSFGNNNDWGGVRDTDGSHRDPRDFLTQQPVSGNFGDFKAAGLYGVNQAHDLYNRPPQFAGFGDTSQQAHNQIQGLATGNPFLPQANQAATNVMGGRNPYVSNLNMNDTNPFLQGFNNFGANQNQAFDSTVDRALSKVSDATNSQFGLSGRTGSGYHAGVMADRLGDTANQMYSDNFAGNQARNLQALQSGASTYGNDQVRNLNAINSGTNAWQGQNAQQLQAAGMIPALNAAKFDDANQLQLLGMSQDAMEQSRLDSPFKNLQNYTDIVAQMQGYQTPERAKSSDWDKLIGLGTIAGGYFS